jgi:hypothetical protein
VSFEMNKDPESFEVLRKLMAFKRHEAPPPGYFHRLSDTIIARIERGEGQLGFWERISTGFTLRPAFAYAFALAACGALATSVYSVRTQSGQAGQQPALAAGWHSGSSGEAFASGYNPAEPLHVANWLGNTNPSAQAPELPSLFAPVSKTVPVSFETRN